MRLSPRAQGAAAAAAALVLDQAHKHWMLAAYGVEAHAPIPLAPFLDVVMSWNRGISYSLFTAGDDAGRWLLAGFQALIIAGLVVWLWRGARGLSAIGLGLVIGGALGNLVDRLVHGAVADFFWLHTELPVGPLANYVFNVADVAITFGVGLLLLDSFRAEKPPAAA